MLEVEVLEVSTSRLSELGIKWPATLTVSTPASVGTLGQLRQLKRDDLLVTSLGATVNLHLDEGDTNVLASPRIRVRNREKAKVMIGSRVPVITNAVTPVSSGTPVVTGSVQYLDVGLKLEVEPDVHLDDEVVIKVALDVSSIIREVPNTQSGTLAYEIGTRNANTVLRLRDGETQILAGLINDEDRKTATKVPGLGQLPLLGRLFSSHKENGAKSEIVLSITPRIVASARPPEGSEVEFWAGSEATLRNGTLNVNPMGSISLSSTGPAASAAPNPAARVPPRVPPRTGAAEGNPAVPAPAAPLPGAVLPGAMPPSAAAAVATAMTAAAAPVILSWEGVNEVAPGGRMELALHVNAQQAVNRLDLTLSFDPQLLQAVEASEGGFLQQGPAPLVMVRNIDQASGQIQLQLAARGSEGVSGAGALVTVTFEALAPAAGTPVALSRVIASGPAGEALPATPPAPHVVRVQP
jgi:general secretion pathway protein D